MKYLFTLVSLFIVPLMIRAQTPLPNPAVVPAGTVQPLVQPAVQQPAVQPATPGVRRITPGLRPFGSVGQSQTRPSTLARPATASGQPAAGAVTSQTDIAGQIESAGKGTNGLPALKFDNAPSDLFLQLYATVTKRTLLIGPDVPKATITLRSETDLNTEEYIQAVENVLLMHGIGLIPSGDKFIQVVPSKDLRARGIVTEFNEPKSGKYPELGRMVSQMITLKSILIEEAKKAIEGFKRSEGQIQVFERTNSILITDTQENVNRMIEIIKFIDQPLPVTEEVFVRSIKFAKAEDLKARIEALVSDSEKQQAKPTVAAAPTTSGSPGFSRMPGIIRPSILNTPAATPNAILETLVSDADRGMIRGKVQIIADERANKMIIITRKENMNFFDKIIEVLDIETAPDVRVKIIRLQFAMVEGKDGEKGVAELLNELIGNASSAKSSSSKSSSSKNKSGSTDSRSNSNTPGGNQNLTTPTPAPAPAASPAANSAAAAGKGRVGELSRENITILADKRINALVVMASPTDMVVLESIIDGLDVELAQVLIETVVLQVQLSSDVQTGIDWIQRVKRKGDTIYAGQGGGNGTVAQNLNKNALGDIAAVGTNGIASAIKGMKWWATFDKLNLDAVISMSREDNRTKVLSSPVLLTVDNKEATIESTQMRYLYKGMQYSGNYNNGGNVPDFEQRDIGLTVKVTPRISPGGNVILTVDEKFESIGPNQSVGNDSYPTVNTRKLQADVSIKSEQTVVLGGLVQSETKKTRSGIPILMDIPWIGQYLFGSTQDSEERTELLVFLTPYVLKNADEAQVEAKRRKDYLNADGVWTKGWSNSKLADPVPKKELLERERIRAANYATEKDSEAALIQFKAETATKDKERDEKLKAVMEKYKTQQGGGTVLLNSGEVKFEESVEAVKPDEKK